MTNLTILTQLAEDLKSGSISSLVRDFLDTPRGAKFEMYYIGKVVSKERPRFGATHAYTAPATREFEKAVKKMAKGVMDARNMVSFKGNVFVTLTIFDVLPKNHKPWEVLLGDAGWINATSGGDIDNKFKAVTDALQGTIYGNDKQVVGFLCTRRYTTKEGFFLKVVPSGLSTYDLMNLKNLMAK